MRKLLELPGRDIFLICDADQQQPAVFYIADRDAGGILVNAPEYSAHVADELNACSPLKFLFIPSHKGALHAPQWKAHFRQLQLISSAEEATQLQQKPDIELDRKTRLTRTIGFIAMSGRTKGTCGLQLRNLPGVVFFGPALDHASDDGWPTLIPHEDDFAWENRVIGSLGLQSLNFQYAFCDNYSSQQNMQYGPDAATHIQHKLETAYE